MKIKYCTINVGSRWGTTHTWGIMVERDEVPERELLSVGCAQDQAESLVARLNAEWEQKTRTMAKVATLLLGTALLAGCTIAPLKGGHASTRQAAGAIDQNITQSDNPAQASRQNQETVRTKSYTVPAGSRLIESHVAPATAGGAAITNASALVISAPMAVTEHEATRATTELGAAQKDTARELSAKLASLKGIVWVGVAMFLFGLASIFYPPLKLVIGSVTTSIAILVGGIALMVLPTMIVGNELLIFGCVAAVVGLWFFAHRHGQLRGMVESNKNGIADRLATPLKEDGKV